MQYTDEHWMSLALQQAQEAMTLDEVPVGAVVVRDGELIAACGNRRETDALATAHAELLAVEQACRRLGRWRLSDCTLYVTLEPCPMCGGAIINARLPRVVFGAYDRRGGVFGSAIDFNTLTFNHRPEVVGGVCEAEAAAILTEYCKRKR